MNIEIRAYQESDKEALADVFFQIRSQEFTWSIPPVTLEDFEHSVEGERIFTALADGKISGFISIWEADNFIHNLFVAKEYRRWGVGKALLDLAADKFGPPLTLKCVKENERAVQFYLSNGWKIEREEQGSEGPYYVMTFKSEH